uniref:Uncharacterized protein n=1 Tax=Panagrolaimus sp. JU765 TaxID=591449 RepID=A0AC34QHH2_9BILA
MKNLTLILLFSTIFVVVLSMNPPMNRQANQRNVQQGQPRMNRALRTLMLNRQKRQTGTNVNPTLVHSKDCGCGCGGNGTKNGYNGYYGYGYGYGY